MDIDLLSKMVKELILDNEKVVLPGLGAFVAEVMPSVFSDRGYTINPPYRKLYFRENPVEGDALAQFYAASNNVDFDFADKIIRDFVSELKNVLFVKKTIVFPGLGRLRATKENSVFFIADADLDIYPEGFALEPVSLKTHEGERTVSAAVEEEEDIEIIAAEDEQSVCPESSVEALVRNTGPTLQEILEKEKTDRKRRLRVFGIVLLSILGLVVALFVMYVAVARLFPTSFDKLLYTEEELEIIYRK